MTREELRQFDGREGRRALIAVNGKIYDVTASERWRGGLHEGEHSAGTDLTEELWQAPHVRAVVERFPVVDTLQEAVQAAPRRMPVVIFAVLLALAVGLGLICLLLR
jgi:predicted heme/steroid binding protein